ncbi:exodeoxyribonuclease VII large subunit [Aestuariivirga litoralis]|uniref:exodeoxyribonuclease VII large subunit n=1 Tax=Aestuariivirga litoralis TaxID=2650924 RepID=UPI0032B1DAF2
MVEYDPETGEILDAAPVSNQGEVSVSELSQALKRTLEDRFGHVRVRGEISGYRGPHSSGHCYFSIKDEGAKIDAIIWRGSFSRLRSKMQDGLEVIATGKISSYPNKSSYQIIVENIEPAGAGALMALLEERKRMLQAEGLFEQSRKKPLPYLPRVIGIVTSPTGAVIRDILHRLNDRFPRQVLVWPVRVQGETAAAEVAAAIKGFNEMADKPDLLIVARGGGSLEDLWPFNEEIVARAVVASAIPLISAVGHETDTTLIDFVSDWRAPTPTAAAERAVPVRADLVAELASLEARQKRGLSRVFSEVKLRLQSAARALPKPDDILAQARQRLDSSAAALPRGLRANLQSHALTLTRQSGRLSLGPLANRVTEARRRLTESQGRATRGLTQLLARKRDMLSSETKLLGALGYKSVLARGFAVLRDASGTPLRGITGIKPNAQLQVEMADGKLDVTATPPKAQKSLF